MNVPALADGGPGLLVEGLTWPLAIAPVLPVVGAASAAVPHGRSTRP